MGNLSSGKSALVHRYLTGTYVQEESPEGEHHGLAWALRLAALFPPCPQLSSVPGRLEPPVLPSLPVSSVGSCGFHQCLAAVGSPSLGPDHALCPRGSV